MNDKHPKNNSDQEENDILDSIFSTSDSLPSKARKSKRTECRPDQTPMWKWILETAGIILGLYVAYIYSGQLSQMIESNKTSRESLTSVQRAFVTFQRFEYFRIQDADRPNVHNWDILADYQNSGSTNATDVAGILEVQELPSEPTEDQFRGAYTRYPVLGIPPKATRAVRIKRPIPEPLIFGIDLGPVINTKSPVQTHFNRHLFVWSWVYYKDIFFPHSKPHISELCNQLTGINLVTENYNPRAGDIGTINFSYSGCKDHNCEDEQCKDYDAIVATAERH